MASHITLNVSGIPESEYSVSFLQAMLDRMGTSYHKYGPIAEAYPDNVDAIRSGLLRLARYIGTRRISEAIAQIVEDNGEIRGDGNLEWIVDEGNFKMIEFIRPSHPKAHFKATSAQESPGRVWQPDSFDGTRETSQRANDLSV